MRRIAPFVAAAVVVALIAVGAVLLFAGGGSKHVTAYFSRAVGVYTGSSVRVLGVQVGQVTGVHNEGTRVRVDMEYDASQKIPADAAAVVVPPSIVSDRYIQLAPAYRGGPVMADGDVIPEDRTEVPAELDEIFDNLDQLNRALGPNGANAQGALSQLIATSAKNLSGNGQNLHDTLDAFAKAIGTLSDNRGDLFGTISNLQQFTSMLANDDGGVRQVNADLAQVSVQLDNERQELAAALKQLGIALGSVTTFVHDNKSRITSDVKDLGSVTSALLTEKQAIIEVLDEAPLALQNLALAYDPSTHTLRTRTPVGGAPNSSPVDTIGGLVCTALSQLGASCPAGGLPLPSAPSGGAVAGGGSLSSVLSGALK